MVTHASSSPEVHNSGRLTIICFMKFHQISSITIFTTPTINIYLYNPHGTGGYPGHTLKNQVGRILLAVQ